MYITKGSAIQLGIIWALLLVLGYLMGNMNASLKSINARLYILEEQKSPTLEPKLKYDIATPEPIESIDEIAERVANQYPRLDYKLLMGVIIVESGGDPNALSPVGAIGLMQIMPATGKEIAQQLGEEWTGPEMLYNVEINIRYGSYYLDRLFERFKGNQQAAIAAYNWGPNHISRRIRNGSSLPVVYPGKVYAAVAATKGTL